MTGSIVSAAVITVPPGLAPGAIYHLVFVTSGTRDATSSNILDYDQFVTDQANLNPVLTGLGTTWRVIGSTATVDADDHVSPLNGPIYRLDGVFVTDPALYTGTLSVPINLNQVGVLTPGIVWTGTSNLNLHKTIYPLGGAPGTPGTMWTTNGRSDFSDVSWLSRNVRPPTESNRLYGISGPLVVASEIPEPATLTLFTAALLGLIWCARRRRSRERSEE
jgi:hypothetical protein